MPKDHAYTLEPGCPTPGRYSLLRPPIASHPGIGVLTDFPSATRFRLTLGADSPCADERCAGNLGLSASRPFTCFIATHVSIRTSDTSRQALAHPSQAYGTLSYHTRNPLSTLSRHDSTLIVALASAVAKRHLTLHTLRARLASSKRRNAQTHSGGLRASLASVIGLQPRYIFRAGRLDQ